MSDKQIKWELDVSGARVESNTINDVLDGVKFRALAISLFLPDGRHAVGLSVNFKEREALSNAYEMLLNCPLRGEVAA